MPYTHIESIAKILETNELQELREHLLQLPDKEKMRAQLLEAFFRHTRYQNAGEWNTAVKLCECLAIIGWGNCEPLEAIKGTYFNGNPNTSFINRKGEPRFLDAVWSKRKEGVAIDARLSFYHASPDTLPAKEKNAGTETHTDGIQDRKLCSQRNWIAKNPICLTRGIANCYENSKAVIESMEKELTPALNERMRPELYGEAVNRIILNCSFSYHDNDHCKTNYIIADDSLKLKQKDFYPVLLGMFPEKEIEANGYYLRNRFTYGPFKPDTGTTRIGIVFEKAFSELPQQRQKQQLSDYLIQAVRQLAKRLTPKIHYNFGLMTDDFTAILKEWCEKEIEPQQQPT